MKCLLYSLEVGGMTAIVWAVIVFILVLAGTGNYETARQWAAWTLYVVGGATFCGMLWFYRYSWR